MRFSSAPAERRIDALDSLRGVAILMVLVCHLVPPPWLHIAQSTAAGIGRGGVILFFLLSGYLIYGNVRRQRVSIFLRRRLFKILPSYWLSLVCVAALDWALPGADHYSWRVYFTNFLMIPDFAGDPQVLSVGWTLLIEVKFYIFIAIQYAILKDRFLVGIAGALVAASIALLELRGHGSQLTACLPAFYVGICIRRAEERGWNATACVAATAIALATAFGMIVSLPNERTWSAIYLVCGAGLFTLFVRYRLGQRWLGFIGMTSYNNYLLHVLVGGLVFTALGSGPVGVATALIGTTALAVVLYHTLEQPLVRLGRRWETAIPGAGLRIEDPAPP